MAATHGVYNKQNTRSENAERGLIRVVILVVPSNKVRVETTLSLAMKPAIRLVTIRQSPKP